MNNLSYRSCGVEPFPPQATTNIHRLNIISQPNPSTSGLTSQMPHKGCRFAEPGRVSGITFGHDAPFLVRGLLWCHPAGHSASKPLLTFCHAKGFFVLFFASFLILCFSFQSRKVTNFLFVHILSRLLIKFSEGIQLSIRPFHVSLMLQSLFPADFVIAVSANSIHPSSEIS